MLQKKKIGKREEQGKDDGGIIRERGEGRSWAEGSRHGDGGSGRKNPHQTRIRGRHRRKRSLKWATANAQGLRHKMNLLRSLK